MVQQSQKQILILLTHTHIPIVPVCLTSSINSWSHHTSKWCDIQYLVGKKKKRLTFLSNFVQAKMSSNCAKELWHQRIFFSNVVVTRKRNLFWGRKWRSLDIKMAIGILLFHILAFFAPFTFTWDAFWIAFFGYILTGIFGITMCYHRLLAHHSLKLPKWLEYTCAYLGVQAIQVLFNIYVFKFCFSIFS